MDAPTGRPRRPPHVLGDDQHGENVAQPLDQIRGKLTGVVVFNEAQKPSMLNASDPHAGNVRRNRTGVKASPTLGGGPAARSPSARNPRALSAAQGRGGASEKTEGVRTATGDLVRRPWLRVCAGAMPEKPKRPPRTPVGPPRTPARRPPGTAKSRNRSRLPLDLVSHIRNADLSRDWGAVTRGRVHIGIGNGRRMPVTRVAGPSPARAPSVLP